VIPAQGCDTIAAIDASTAQRCCKTHRARHHLVEAITVNAAVRQPRRNTLIAEQRPGASADDGNRQRGIHCQAVHRCLDSSLFSSGSPR